MAQVRLTLAQSYFPEIIHPAQLAFQFYLIKREPPGFHLVGRKPPDQGGPHRHAGSVLDSS